MLRDANSVVEAAAGTLSADDVGLFGLVSIKPSHPGRFSGRLAGVIGVGLFGFLLMLLGMLHFSQRDRGEGARSYFGWRYWTARGKGARTTFAAAELALGLGLVLVSIRAH
jgi:hypothetical protein